MKKSKRQAKALRALPLGVGICIGFSTTAIAESPGVPRTIAAQVVLEQKFGDGSREFKNVEFVYSEGTQDSQGADFCSINELVLEDACGRHDEGRGIRFTRKTNIHNTQERRSAGTVLACSLDRISESMVFLRAVESIGFEETPSFRDVHELTIDISRRSLYEPGSVMYGSTSSLYPVIAYSGRSYNYLFGENVRITLLRPLVAASPDDLTVRIPLSCPYLDFPAVQSR